VAEGPRRPGAPGERPPSSRVTAPRLSVPSAQERSEARVTQPMAAARGKALESAVVNEGDDPTRAMEPGELPGRKFVSPEELRTTVVPGRGRVGTPSGTPVSPGGVGRSTPPMGVGARDTQRNIDVAGAMGPATGLVSGGERVGAGGAGANANLGSGANANVGSGANANLGSGANANVGSGANANVGSGANANLGSGANANLGSGANANVGSGANANVGSGANPGAAFAGSSGGGGVAMGAPTTSMVAVARAASGEPVVQVRAGAVDAGPRTQVWVATHKPPEDPDERLILLREPDSARAASFRVLRHRLQEHGDPRRIAVTSALPREGKTTCAVNLALALGECNRARVLLVEANLRAPSLAPLFGFMPPEGFATQLTRHKDKPEEAWSVVEVYSPSLHVLAVKPEAEGRPLLDGPAFAIAIEMLSQAGYDYIVVDTPPVLGAADVNLVEDCVDGVLFTAWSGATPARALRQAVEQLQPAKLLGVTLLDA
jgi:Mrp family chromosome partitioning ATPase